MRVFEALSAAIRMQRSNLTISFVAFVAIWSIWSIWSALEPVLNSAQLAVLFLFLPLSVLLLAFSFLDDEDDDDFRGGRMQPIFQRAKPN